MKEEEAIRIFEETKAILKGHFVYKSSMHGEVYINKDAIFTNTFYTRQFCEAIAEHFKDAKIDIVAGPAIGGALIAQWVAYKLSELTDKDIKAIYSEDGPNNTKIFKRGYDKYIPGKRALIVEDITTTGGSIRKTVEVVELLEGKVAGVGLLWNRGAVKAKDLGISELYSLINKAFGVYDPAECPLCQNNIPINTNVGHGKAFLAQKTQ